jgi:hypothetical protein
MATTNVGFSVTVESNDATKSIKELRTEIEQTTKAVEDLGTQYGENSKEVEAAQKRLANLQDLTNQKQEENNQRIDNAAKTVSALSAAYGGVQGALELTGLAGEDTIKQLAKIQSALAIGDAVQNIAEFRGAIVSTFTDLKDGAVKAFQAVKAGIGSTGIGVLVLALGAIVAYWDDIKEAVSGVSSSQKDLLESTKADAKAQQDKLSTIDSQDNVLKLQGKSEKEILGLKIKQTGEVISATERQVAQQKIVLQAQLSAERRNKEILKGILTFVTAPLQLVIDGVNQVAKVFGKGFEFNVADKLSGLVFDPKATEKKGQEEIAALDKTLGELKNKKAGYQLSLQGIDKQAASAASATATKAQQEALKLAAEKAAAEKEAKLKLEEINNQIFLASFKKENERKAAELNLAFIKEKDQILANTKITEDTRNQLILAARIKLNSNLDALKQAENEKKAAEDAKMLEEAAAQMAKEDDLEFANLQKKFAKTQDDDKKQAAKDLADLDKKLAKNETDLQIEKDLLDQRDALLEEQYANSLISEDQYTANIEANAKARIDISKKEAEQKIALAQQTASALTALSDIVGKETAAGKALAISAALINTYLGITAGVKLGFPAAIPAVTIAAATGFSAVKNIIATKVPGGSSSGGAGNMTTPNMSATAPIAPAQPQAATTNISAQSINALGNQAIRSYVVESDVTNSQQRMAAIQQRARFG